MQETETWKEWIPLLVDPQNKEAMYLEPSVREAIAEILDQAEEEGRLFQLLDAVQEQFSGPGVHPAAHTLMGLANMRLERMPEAISMLTSVCNRLEKERRWVPLEWVARHFFEGTGALKAARFLTKVAEEAGLEALPGGLLDRVYEAFPDEHRLAYLKAQQARATGDEESVQRYLFQSLQGFLQTHRGDRIEEIYLELVGRVDEETLHRLFRGAVRLARKKWEMADPLFDLILPHLTSRELAREGWDTFLELLPKNKDAASTLQRFLRTLAPLAFPEVEDVDRVLMQSGLYDEETKPETAVNNLKALLDLAPGYYVMHANWGVGKIASNDGESIIIDFIPDKPGHRMSLQMATRALEVLPPDDLRVLEVSRPEELQRIAREEPEHLVYLALREAGGQATTTVLRKRLNDIVAPVKSWASWWKEAKARLEGHPRVDMSLAFRNTYRIIEGLGGEEEISLPSLDRKRGVRANLNLIHRFLEQHPGSKSASRHIHGPILKRWVHDERTHADDRVALHLFLESELDIREEGRNEAIRQALAQGLEPADMGEVHQQLTILDAGFSNSESESDAIMFGLASRHERVRDEALKRVREKPDHGRSLLTGLLRNPAERPVMALAVILQTVKAAPDDPVWPDPWEAACGAALLADVTTRDTLRRQAVAILDPQGPLADRLRQTPAPEEIPSYWSLLLRQWHSSERALFHIYTFLKEVGLESVVNEVSAQRSEATNRALRASGQTLEIHGIPMTQSTYQSLLKERDEVEYALRTTIPEAIKKAREMGDLRENAEYDAAKETQAKETARLNSLKRRLQQAEIIENMSIPEGQAGPGTEVVLESPQGERRTYWILGEGDAHHGDDVISIMAPLGQTLLGHVTGDTITVQDGDGAREFRLVQIHHRLPEQA
ncbi:MAG: hypothetical protein GF355_00120 [Candidatus Eisenbacteria bacterium]|nr:hypothetical protein [Candidatus Eisenbacteria bacterium]